MQSKQELVNDFNKAKNSNLWTNMPESQRTEYQKAYESKLATFEADEAESDTTNDEPATSSTQTARDFNKIRNSDYWDSIPDEEKTAVTESIKTKHRAELQREGVDPNFNVDKFVQDETVKPYMPAPAPKVMADPSAGTFVKAIAKSGARAVPRFASFLTSIGGAGIDLAGKGIKNIPYAEGVGDYISQKGQDVMAATDIADAWVKNALPAEQTAPESVKDFTDMTTGQKLVFLADQVPEQAASFLIPGALGAKGAQMAIAGSKAAKVAGVLPNLAKWAGPKMAQLGGAYLGSTAMSAAEIAKEQLQATGKTDAPSMIVGGAVAGALESIVPGGAEWLSGSFKGATRRAVQAAVKNPAKFLGHVFKEATKNGVVEGATETLQEAVNIYSVEHAKGKDGQGIVTASAYINEILATKGIEGLIEEAKTNPTVGRLAAAALLGSASGAAFSGVGSANHGANYAASPISAYDNLINAKTAEEKAAAQKIWDSLSQIARTEAKNEVGYRSIFELNDAETDEDSVQEAFGAFRRMDEGELEKLYSSAAKNGLVRSEISQERIEKFLEGEADRHGQEIPAEILPTVADLDNKLVKGLESNEKTQKTYISEVLDLIDSIKPGDKKAQEDGDAFLDDLFAKFDPTYIESVMNSREANTQEKEISARLAAIETLQKEGNPLSIGKAKVLTEALFNQYKPQHIQTVIDRQIVEKKKSDVIAANKQAQDELKRKADEEYSAEAGKARALQSGIEDRKKGNIDADVNRAVSILQYIRETKGSPDPMIEASRKEAKQAFSALPKHISTMALKEYDQRLNGQVAAGTVETPAAELVKPSTQATAPAISPNQAPEITQPAPAQKPAAVSGKPADANSDIAISLRKAIEIEEEGEATEAIRQILLDHPRDQVKKIAQQYYPGSGIEVEIDAVANDLDKMDPYRIKRDQLLNSIDSMEGEAPATTAKPMPKAKPSKSLAELVDDITDGNGEEYAAYMNALAASPDGEQKESMQTESPEELTAMFPPEDLIASKSGQEISGKEISGRGVAGKSTRIRAGDISADGHYAIVELDGLTRNMKMGEHQNRDRERAASLAQISAISDNPDPDKLISPDIFANDGPPVVGPDYVVESGNGRTEGLSQAYTRGRGEGYRQALIQSAESFGIPASEVLKLKKPVLVRVRSGDLQGKSRSDFIAAANAPRQLQRSPSEKAVTDGQAILPFLDKLETQNLNTKANAPFFTEFFSKVATAEEAGALTLPNGDVSQEGLNRVRNAIFAAAYGNPEILVALTEDPDPKIRSILGGLQEAVIDTARLTAEARRDAAHPISINSILPGAARKIADIRQTGVDLEEYLMQGQFGKDGLQPAERILLGFFATQKSAQKIGTLIKTFNDIVRSYGPPGQMAFPGMESEVPGVDEVLNMAIAKEFPELTERSKRWAEGPAALDVNFSKKGEKQSGDDRLMKILDLLGQNAEKDPELSKSTNKVVQLLNSMNPDAKSGPGMAREELDAIARTISKNLDPENGLRVVVVESTKELSEAAGTDVPGGVEGAISGKTIYLVRENLDDATRAQEVAGHEIIGHYGLKKLLGEKEWNSLARSFYALRETDSDVKNEITRAANDYSELGASGIIDEALARTAENYAADPEGFSNKVKAWFNDFVAQIQDSLRVMGKDIKFNQRDLGRVMRAAKKSVTNKGKFTSKGPEIDTYEKAAELDRKYEADGMGEIWRFAKKARSNSINEEKFQRRLRDNPLWEHLTPEKQEELLNNTRGRVGGVERRLRKVRTEAARRKPDADVPIRELLKNKYGKGPTWANFLVPGEGASKEGFEIAKDILSKNPGLKAFRVMIDIKNLKKINDLSGSEENTNTNFLSSFAQSFKEAIDAISNNSLMVKFGGDEWDSVIISGSKTDEDEIRQYLQIAHEKAIKHAAAMGIPSTVENARAQQPKLEGKALRIAYAADPNNPELEELISEYSNRLWNYLTGRGMGFRIGVSEITADKSFVKSADEISAQHHAEKEGLTLDAEATRELEEILAGNVSRIRDGLPPISFSRKRGMAENDTKGTGRLQKDPGERTGNFDSENQVSDDEKVLPSRLDTLLDQFGDEPQAKPENNKLLDALDSIAPTAPSGAIPSFFDFILKEKKVSPKDVAKDRDLIREYRAEYRQKYGEAIDNPPATLLHKLSGKQIPNIPAYPLHPWEDVEGKFESEDHQMSSMDNYLKKDLPRFKSALERFAAETPDVLPFATRNNELYHVVTKNLSAKNPWRTTTFYNDPNRGIIPSGHGEHRTKVEAIEDAYAHGHNQFRPDISFSRKQLQAAEGSEDNKLLSALDSLPDPELIETLEKNGVSYKIERDLSEDPRFSKKSPHSVSDRAAPGEQLTIDFLGDVPWNTEIPAPLAEKFYQTTKHIRVGSFEHNMEHVTNEREASNVFAPMARGAREQVAMLILDDKDKPLAIFRVSMGTKDSSSAYPDEMMAGVLRTPGAAKFYIGHNHPSGSVKFSDADMLLANALRKNAAGMGVEFMGSVVVGDDTARFDNGSPGQEFHIPSGGKKTSTDVLMSEFESRSKSAVVTNAEAVADYLNSEESFLDKQSGILLLDHQLRVVGEIAMDHSEMLKLRANNKSTAGSRLLQVMDKANANAMIATSMVKSSKEHAAISNNLTEFGNAFNIRVLDVINLSGTGKVNITSQNSARDLGYLRSSGTLFFSKKKGEPGLKYSYAGVIGKNPKNFSEVERRLNAGEDPETVRKETGWFKNPYDKHYRFELDDSKMKFDYDKLADEEFSQANLKTKLSDILDHPELFEAYPELRNLSVMNADIGKSNGQYAPGKNGDLGWLAINKKNLTPEEAKDTLVHEIQHVIQEIEGFAKGGSPGEFIAKRKKQIDDLFEEVRYLNREMSQAVGTPAYRELIDRRSEITAKIRALEGNSELGAIEEGFNDYKRTAGEIEARDVTERRNLPPAARKRFKPLTDRLTHSELKYQPDEALIRYSYAGKAAIRPEKAATWKNARTMLDAGEDPETVRKETGWFVSPYDSQPRFELDDSKARWNERSLNKFLAKNPNTGAQIGLLTMSDALDHKDLFRAYPQLKDMRLRIAISPKEGTDGYFRSGGGKDPEIFVQAPDFETLKEVALHEIQHAIQNIEGFARGGSPLDFEPDSGDDARRKAAESWSVKAREVFANASPEFQSAARAMNREFDLDKVGTGEDQSAGYEAARRKLYEISEDEAWDYLTYSDSADRVWHGQFDRDANGDLVRPASSADKYRRLAGEIEARDTAERTELTREEREEFPPFSTAGYDPKDAIVQFSKKLKEDQKKNLYVAHNLSAGNLLHAEEIGGLAMPSVAVASVDAGPFSGFGDITLLAKPDLLESPKAKTFDADIYSPRHPASKADINDKKYSAFIDSLGDPQGLNSLYRHEPPQDPQVLFHNSAVRLAWLRSKGLAPEAKKKAHSEIFEKLSKFKGHRFDLRENPEVKKLVAEHYRQILESFPEEDREYFSSRYFQENGEVKENLVGHVLTDAEYWAKDGGIDTAQLREDIDKIIKDPENRKEFEAWTEEKFNSMTDGRKLFAGFNSKGQKKYKPYTMENIVKEMGKSLKGGEAFSYSGAAPIRAAHAKQYKSIEAIQADRNRIVSDADFEAIKEESNKKLSDLLEEIRPFYKFSAQGLDYSLDAGKAIAEGPKGLREAFDLDEDANKKVQEFVSYLKKLPTEYFEAKIQRAVSLSEFETAIVPEGTQAKIIDALENKGVRVATYKAGDHEDRLRAIRENATLFSKKSSADPLDPDPEPMPTLTEVSKSQANLLTDSLKKIAGGLLGDTKSQADRKRPDFQRAAALNPEADTDWEMDRDNKNKASVESRKFEDQLILKHLDADKNLIISTIKKLPDGDLRDWALKKAARVLAPYQAAKPIERLLFTVAEGITWDGSKIVASPGVRQFNKESGEYYYEKDQERARAAMHFFNSLSPEWREIMTERAKNNEEYRQEFTGKVIPYRKAQVAIALLARAKQMNASRSEQEGAEAEARSSIDAIKGKIDTKDLTKLRSLLDQLSNVTPENMPRQILSLEHIIRDSVGELRSPASLRAELKKLNTNKGHYGYVHHHFTGEKTPSQGKAFDALGKIPHSWLEETPGSDKLRVNAEGYEKNLLRADIARSSKELRAEAANNWMSQVEDQRGLPTEEFADHEEMPDGYAEKKKVIANFGKYRGQEIYLPDGLYEHYKLVKEKGLEDPGMKDFGEVVQLVDSVTNRMNEAMLYHTGKFARDMFAMPLHLMEFMRDYSIKNPREIFFTMKALTKALGQAATPKAWQKDTPESFGEYSESLAYQNKGDETSFFTKAGDSIGSWLTKTVPVGSTAAALLREINLSGAGDLPIKRVLQSVGEQIADKRGLSGKERSRFIFDLVNEYGFYTQDLPTILSYMRGQRPTQGSRAWGAIMRTTLPFLGYSSRLVKQMIADPVTKGMAPLAKRAVGMADQNSNLLAEISEASRPFAWLFLKSLVTAGLGGLIPPEEEGLATGVQDAKNLDPLARTTGRVLWSRDKNPDGGENWLSTKGLGQFQVADSIDAAIRGKSSIQDFSAEFLTLHPSMQLFLSTLGVSDPYSAKVPMTAKLGRSMAQAMVPQFTRVGPELAKFFRAVSGANTIPDAKKQTFFTAFFEQLGIPAGEVKVDSKGKIRTTENGLELLKLAGINIRHIPYDMISAAAEDEVKGLDYLEKRLDKIQEYRDGDRNPGMPEREFIAQELKSNRWLTIDEAEKETTDELKKRGQGILATVAKLREKGRPIAAPEPPKKAARGGFADPFKSKMFRDPFEEKKEKKEKRKTIEDIIRDIGNDTTVPKGGIDDILNRL